MLTLFGVSCCVFIAVCYIRDVEREEFKYHLQKEMEKDYIIAPKRQEIIRSFFAYKSEGNA